MWVLYLLAFWGIFQQLDQLGALLGVNGLWHDTLKNTS